MFEHLYKWFVEPFIKNDVGNIIAIIALFVTLISILVSSIKKLFSPTKIKVVFDKQQSFISRIASTNVKVNNKFCLGFYFIKLVGLKKNATSIKSIKVFLKMNNKWIEGNKVNIYIQQKEHEQKGNIDCLVLANSSDAIVLMNWKDISEMMNKAINYGEVQIGSAVYIFSESYEQIKEAKKIKFLVEDNFDRKYRFTSKPELIDALKKNFSVIDFKMKI
jgi:hypothetical protein